MLRAGSISAEGNRGMISDLVRWRRFVCEGGGVVKDLSLT